MIFTMIANMTRLISFGNVEGLVQVFPKEQTYPVVLGICQASRRIGMAIYTRARCCSSERPFYFNFETDVFFHGDIWDYTTRGWHWNGFEDVRSQIRHIAFSTSNLAIDYQRIASHLDTLSNNGSLRLYNALSFPSIESVVFLYDTTSLNIPLFFGSVLDDLAASIIRNKVLSSTIDTSPLIPTLIGSSTVEGPPTIGVIEGSPVVTVTEGRIFSLDVVQVQLRRDLNMDKKTRRSLIYYGIRSWMSKSHVPSANQDCFEYDHE
ncbi:hypothetical protein B0T17DRAFT_535232 [Bombardia bombarda]|uniref:Uncharacterized protein n=1 Tax=Bombardia bombarda TaxID=252184 RepID=A0AA39WV13_9PEZI|nr:hypothetical protein B0T17DRAFT_535232 [Bombardia bombarda]